MLSEESTDSSETTELLGRIALGDERSLERLFEQHRGFLRRLLAVRMDPALRRRIDPSDVVQETLIVATNRMDDFLARRPTSFRLWLRRKAIERLIEHRRKHYAQKRSVDRDLSMDDASSAIVVSLFGPRPSDVLIRQELQQQVQRALGLLADTDREMLLLRHAEELSNGEVAELLGLDVKTASKRYGRALMRLSSRLADAGISF